MVFRKYEKFYHGSEKKNTEKLCTVAKSLKEMAKRKENFAGNFESFIKLHTKCREEAGVNAGKMQGKTGGEMQSLRNGEAISCERLHLWTEEK